MRRDSRYVSWKKDTVIPGMQRASLIRHINRMTKCMHSAIKIPPGPGHREDAGDVDSVYAIF